MLSNRLKTVIAMIVYQCGTSVFFGWVFSGGDMKFLLPVGVCFGIAQAAAVYIFVLVHKTEP